VLWTLLVATPAFIKLTEPVDLISIMVVEWKAASYEGRLPFSLLLITAEAGSKRSEVMYSPELRLRYRPVARFETL
jgi:hypothetical protein